MNTLFLVQFACCIIVSMLGLILVLSRFQIRWTNRRYEVSRWLLAFSMFVLAWHYVLQMFICHFLPVLHLQVLQKQPSLRIWVPSLTVVSKSIQM